MRSPTSLLLTLLTASCALVYGLDDSAIRARQYHPHRLDERAILARRSANALSNLDSLQTNLNSPISNAQQDLVNLKNCKTPSQVAAVGRSLCNHVSQCHQAIKSCGSGGWGGTKPSGPLPSTTPGKGKTPPSGGGPTCGDVGKKYCDTATSVGTLCSKLKVILHTFDAETQSTLTASMEEIDSELSSVLEAADNAVPGTTTVVSDAVNSSWGLKDMSWSAIPNTLGHLKH